MQILSWFESQDFHFVSDPSWPKFRCGLYVPCPGCPNVHLRKTSQLLRCRMYRPRNDLQNQNSHTFLASHTVEVGHSVDSEGVVIVVSKESKEKEVRSYQYFQTFWQLMLILKSMRAVTCLFYQPGDERCTFETRRRFKYVKLWNNSRNLCE